MALPFKVPYRVVPGVDTLLAIAVCVVSGCGHFSKDCALLVPYCPVWVVGGYGCPAKEREGTPVFPYCLFGVVGGCGRPARDRKDYFWREPVLFLSTR